MNKYHTSILDTDLYKASMQAAVCKLYPREKVRYTFINRGKTVFPNGFADRLRSIINTWTDKALTDDEAVFLREKCGAYLDPVYIDFLKGYRYDPTEVTIVMCGVANEFNQKIGERVEVSIEGYWYRTILWEVPLMQTISELYFEMLNIKPDAKTTLELDTRDILKATHLNGICKWSDFGSRRRYSYENQKRILSIMCQAGNFLGTSNVHFAHKFGLTPIGTHAHEWFQFHAAKFGPKMANRMALDAWVNVFGGSLGIALTDTFTTDAFFRPDGFSLVHAKMFDGVRHDSGDPLVFIDKAVAYYKSLGIDPLTKTAIFSDGISSLETVEKIVKACDGKIKPRFGIGTWLTNDLPGVKPLNIVIKMTAIQNGDWWIPTVKLSDVETKHTGNEQMITRYKQELLLDKGKGTI